MKEMQNMSRKNRTVAVTGAAGGIGRAVCERLAGNGWNVVASDLSETELQWAADFENIVSHAGDISCLESNQSMITTAENCFGGLDAVILNAGLPMAGSIEKIAWEDFERVVRVNLLGTALGVRCSLPALRRRGGGAIVVTSSLHGLAGEVDNCAYVATKHALVGLVRSTARDVGWEGIRINAICPGLTRQTGMTSFLETEGFPAEVLQQLVSGIPLQRSAEADEVAAVMEFFISPESSYINGVALPVDGGAMTASGLRLPANG